LAGIGTWLAVDVIVLRADEYLNRDDMRADIMARLHDAHQQLVEALAVANAARIDGAVENISASHSEVFSPVREGLGRAKSW
jgi:hypothetical protein